MISTFNYMKQRLPILAAALLLFASCRTTQVAYISDATRDSAQTILDTYTATILPGDQLYIYVESQTPESVIPFNQETHKAQIELSRAINLDTSQRGLIQQQNAVMQNQTQYITTEVTGYTVNEQGQISFPILGQISAAGLTLDSLMSHIAQRLKNEGLVNDPTVTAKIMNFRVTVVGEVRSPQQIHVQGTRLTILEAIAICGDLTDNAIRDKLVVIRSDGGNRQMGEINLTTKELLDSPYYYLHNNDIVYVEPTERHKRISDRNPDTPKYISIAVSVASLIRTNLQTARFNQTK